MRLYLVRELENPWRKKEEKVLALVKEGAIGDRNGVDSVISNDFVV